MMTKIILPQAAVAAIPPIVNSCQDIIKMSSLGMTIGIQDIMGETQLGVRGTTFKRPGLLKRTFDEYHVRFIAANDNLDTANGFDIMSIFRDVINEWYVADTSRKIKTVFKSRMEKYHRKKQESERTA